MSTPPKEKMSTTQPRRSFFASAREMGSNLEAATRLGAEKIRGHATRTGVAFNKKKEELERKRTDTRINSCIEILKSARYKVEAPPTPKPRPKLSLPLGGRRRRTRHRKRSAHKKRTIRRRKHATRKRHRRRVRTRRRRRRR